MKRRALSTIVGAVFFVIVMASTISYVAYSMNLIDDLARSVDVKQDENLNKQNEEFKVMGTTVDGNNKFNITVQNSGNIPIKITRLYVENTTDSNWNPTKYEINTEIAPGEQKHSIASNLSLDYVDSESYLFSFLTERGNTEKFAINSGGNQPLYTDLFALPNTVPTGFNTVFLYTVVNNSTGQLLNIQVPDNLLVTEFCSACSTTKQSGPIPKSYPSLAPGDMATFQWSYKLNGDDQDRIKYNATLVNAYPGVWDTEDVSIVLVALAAESGTSLTASGLGELTAGENVLVLHEESNLNPNNEYHMYSGIADGGNDGLVIELDADAPVQWLTKNSTKNITVDNGTWTASLQIQSAAVPTTISSLTNGYDLIYHFEDGFSFSTIDNSESDSSRDLEGGCDSDPTFTATGGPHGSGAYHFDADAAQKQCFQSSNNVSNNDDNDIGNISGQDTGTTTALWFKTDDTNPLSEEEYLVYWEGNGGNADYYKISLLTNGIVEFEIKSEHPGGTITCQSNSSYNDGAWHHIVATRELNGPNHRCELDVYTPGGSNDSNNNQASVSNDVSTSGRWVVGANKAQNGNYFDGYIDDLMHWDDDTFSNPQITDLHNTNYGNAAHHVDLYLGKTDQDGLNPSTITSTLNVPLVFSDPKGLGDNDDGGYAIANATIPDFGVLDLIGGERLNFTMNFVPSNSTWESLELDLKVDDEDFTPHESYLDMPAAPTNPFPSFQTFTTDENMIFWFSNTGDNGVYLRQAGTRLALNGTAGEGGFGALPYHVNGTSPQEEVWWDRDSIYFPPDSVGYVEFYRASQHPTDDNPFLGPAPTPGLYDAVIWIMGYDDGGAKFERSFDLGVIILE